MKKLPQLTVDQTVWFEHEDKLIQARVRQLDTQHVILEYKQKEFLPNQARTPFWTRQSLTLKIIKGEYLDDTRPVKIVTV